MGFFKSSKGSIISDYFQLTEDLGPFVKDDMVDVALHEDHLELKNLRSKDPLTLDYSQITDVFYGPDVQIVEKGKSVIGRAVAGGLLFGSVGAVVGAASGLGTKEKKVKRVILVISYTPSQGGDAFLQFEDTRMYKGPKVAMKLRELCHIKDEPGPAKDEPINTKL